MTRKILLTGSAGFIGFHLAKRLLDSGISVVGVDSLNDYYDPKLKNLRNEILLEYPNYTFYNANITSVERMDEIFDTENPTDVVHLAAQAGVRDSAKNPFVYEKTNILGTLVVFECAVRKKVSRVLYASSSSVYGDNHKLPFSEDDVTDSPVSIYAVTKKTSELMAYHYNKISKIPFIGFRFFTVYGPSGRPDMAVFKFAKNIALGKEITLFGNGEMKRDFTYVDDIVSGLVSGLDADISGSRVYNLGNNHVTSTLELVRLLENNLGADAKLKLVPDRKGEMLITWADISRAREELGYDPKTGIEEGIRSFCKWFIDNKRFIMDMND